ncbi:hypothetical protein V8G54_002897, partial [Vigna mungo]
PICSSGASHINTNLDGETFQCRSSIYLPSSISISLKNTYIIMENTRVRNIALVLLLFFILHHQSVFVEGRHLRSPLCEECSKPHQNHTMSGDGMNDDVVHQEGSRRVEYEVDDFRPTTPGHSPGVGHSINN